MSKKFSIDSLDYFAEKFANCPSLSDEALLYLSSQRTQSIVKLLQDAHQVQRKCRRIDLTADDFSLALKLHQIDPIYNTYATSSLSFRKMKKDTRLVYQIDDPILSFKEVIHSRSKPVPIDISIRTHWLVIDGQQPEVPENPVIDRPIRRTISRKKPNKHPHLLFMEQQIYFKELTEMCVCANEHNRQQALVILSTDPSLGQILSRLLIFISEGIRMNLMKSSRIVKYLLQMIEALLQNAHLSFEPYLHFLFPSLLSCLLNHRKFADHWSLRDLAAKCSGRILRFASTNQLLNHFHSRTVDLFIGLFHSHRSTLATQYGALLGLCEINHQVIIQIVFPLIKQLGETIRHLQDQEFIDKCTEIVLKYALIAYRSNEYECEKNLYEDFGSYFGPLLHQQLILLM